MTALLENPMPIILFGIVAEAVLGISLLTTRRGALLWAMAGVLILVLAGVGLEWLVVTERERVEATLEGAAAAVRANDREGLLQRIHPSAADARQLVNWAFDRVDFTDAKITTLEVQNINDLTSPPTAKAHVKGIVFFKVRRGEYPYDKHPVDLTAELRLESGRWLITGYELRDDPRGN
jgi:hypothetical protein